jgi:hypothetical protein
MSKRQRKSERLRAFAEMNERDIRKECAMPAVIDGKEYRYIEGAKLEVLPGGYTVEWRDEVYVQVIPGMERTGGVPGNVYVDPASVPVVPISEWGKK